MNKRVQVIRSSVKNGTYNWETAIETLAEKAVIIYEVYGSVWGVNLKG